MSVTPNVRSQCNSYRVRKCSLKSKLKTDKLEAKSHRENWRFFNIDEAVSETLEKSEQRVRDYKQT